MTLRARRRLQEADVVLYDALVHPEQLAHCRPDAEQVFVGKRAGRQSERQDHINERMIAAARAGKTVVRLKGGDPYLFGRGSEEAEALAAAGIPFEVVPGVPSPLAAAAYTGISLTHRDLASSIAYVTATESPDKDRSAHDWSRLATATQTLVFFMGLRKLEVLMALLMEHGRAADTPAAVVQWASTARQRTVVATVGTLAQRVREAGIEMPALTIVGEAVRLREQLRWFDNKPLFGKRVLVTRPVHQAGSLSQLLRDEAADPIEAPTIRIAPPSDPTPLRQAVARLDDYRCVVLTSRNGVERLFEEIRAQGGDARRLGRARVVAIGPKTAQALASRGVIADRTPDEYRGEAAAEAVLAELGAEEARGARILLPRAREAREVLPERLRAAGAQVDVVEAYQTLPPEPEAVQRIRALVAERTIDVVTFTSSSTVRNLVDVLGPDAAAQLGRAMVASIGPITTQTAQELGLRVDVTAREYTTAGLVAALRTHFAPR
jgi:uroporphyrinogen III methyltransferase / synthase